MRDLATKHILIALFFASNAIGPLPLYAQVQLFPAAPIASPASGSQDSASSEEQPPAIAPPLAAPSAAPSTTSPAPVADDSGVTPESITAFLQQLQTATDIEPALKARLQSTYESLLTEINRRTENEARIKQLNAAQLAAPNAIAEAKRQKEVFTPQFVYMAGSLQRASLTDLQNYQATLQTLLQSATDGLARVDERIVTREAQRKEIPRFLTEARAAITKLNDELNAPAPDGTHPRLRDAHILLLRAQLKSNNDLVRLREQELRTYDAESELLTLQKGNFAAEEKHYQAKIKEVNEELNKRREILITRLKQLAESYVSQSPPELVERANETVARTDAWLTLARQNWVMRLELDAAQAELKMWEDRYHIMTDRIRNDRDNKRKNVLNFNSWVGLMLRKQRSELPDVNELNRKLYVYHQKMLEAEALALSLEDWRAEHASSEGAESPNEEDERRYAFVDSREKAKLLFNLERRVVDDFRVDTKNYIDRLLDLADKTQKTVEQVRLYRSFIDEHVLWIRSGEVFNGKDAQHVWPALEWLFKLGNWREVGRTLVTDLQERLWPYLLGAGLFGLLLVNLPRFKREVRVQGDLAKRPNCISMIPTWKAFVVTVLIGLPLAIVPLVVGWRLSNSENHSFPGAIGLALMVGARYFFPLELLRQICRMNGLAESHFQWSRESTQLLRKNLRWFIDLAVPSVVILVIVTVGEGGKYENSLGRVVFSCLMILCFILLMRCLHPTQGVFQNFLKQNQGGWIDRLRYIWYPTLVFSPLALMLMSWMGYHYTAVRLTSHLHTTFLALVGILILSCFIYRWLLLRRRELLVAQAKQRLEEARRRDPNSTALPASQLDTQADVASINKQTVRLISSAMLFASIGAVAFIWSGVLPAVGVLNSVGIGWSAVGEDGSRIPITLMHLLIAIPTGIMTIVAARNLPGLLEIALLQHLPLENAVRYAISSISRYAIFFLGIVVTFGYLGISWTSIQWLVAALGVGLGFGLQEIFANFVSGLILLFEQPVRVGDVITLGDTTGTVSRIRMRATTVTNFDQQELIIPNKDLVTGRLLNWTLSDTTNRIIIAIGISYESDAEVACETIREICLAHPNVLKDPAPSAFVDNFGDSKIEIHVRCYLSTFDIRLITRHEVQMEIRRRFAELGISTWLPQREIRLRSNSADVEQNPFR